ncbi:LOW QUALITY PROTEIN: uncharacterized protein EMH_0046390 [Eimeria mitis]|uniref:Uncharacterized protein n=1 Tax=Eimeria mitis TaxID=44415 RepID=U6JUF2_9EIME|nr:LOW QUALITY PROTEIN: uncharacterized protein EMH_0046390 [Eimeria mitis]CDJ29039.1 hypothetical protein, conserved [Eimeria mitis]
MQANVYAHRVVSSIPATGSDEKSSKVEPEASFVAAADVAARGVPSSTKHPLQEVPDSPAGLPGVLPGKALKHADGIKDIPQDGGCNSPPADTECSNDKPGQHHIGLQQLALQAALLLVSWVFLALIQANGRPTEGRKEPEQGRLSALFGHLRSRCWSRLPLRYWHCAFYLLLLLAAFWAASVVWEDSQEGLQVLQGGGGTPLPSSQTWMGGGLPPLLLNSDSPQHVKIAATAVARGREASDQLLWLLHSAAQQQFGRVLLWLRALTLWLNSFLLQPFVALLRHTGVLASVNGTCSVSDAPEAASDSWDSQAPRTLFCVVTGQKVALAGKRGRLCGASLAGFAAFKHLLFVWGIGQGGSLTRPWGESLAVACKSSLTAFAVAFVLLALLWCAAAVVARCVALVGSVWGRLLGRRPVAAASSRQRKAKDCSTDGHSSRIDTGSCRGAAWLEILAACLTCWVLLLSDREFVMFTWTTLQPLRLSVLSTVLLLRLPSSQVAALLTWPPPLREPALVLQRSQPLKIIDPVAVGSMLGCVLAAAVLRLVLLLMAKLGGLVKSNFTPSCTAQADGDLRLLGVSRGQWAGAKLKEETRAQAAKTPLEGHSNNSPRILPDKPHADFRRVFTAAEEALRGKQQQSQHQNQLRHGQQDGEDIAKDVQQRGPEAAQQQTSVFFEQLQAAQKQVEELQRQLLGVQSQLLEMQQKRDSEAAAYLERQQQLEAEAALWRGKEEEARAEHARLKADIAEAARSLESLREAHRAQQQQASATQAEDKAQINCMKQLLQKQAEDMANKTAEINELREKLAQALSVASGITKGIRQQVEIDAKTVSMHKMHLSTIVSRTFPKLSHASDTAGSGNASTYTEQHAKHTSGDTVASGDDPPLLEDPRYMDASPKRSTGTFRRAELKEALSKDESRKLEEALNTISKCIFPLGTVLKYLELPQATLDAARQLLGTTKHYTGDSGMLHEILARTSACTWKGDVEALATVLAALGRAWPSEESCERLLQRKSDAHLLSAVEQKFLPLAVVPRGRQRVTIVQFVVGLHAQWQAACRRLKRLEEAIGLLQRSSVLRILCETCVALHDEMKRAFTSEGFQDAVGTVAEQETKGATVPTASARSCARIWETRESRDDALRRFKVWKDNGDFNFACLKNAADICPPRLQGLSLLHHILSLAETAASGNAAANGGEAERDGTLPQRLKLEIYGDISPPLSSSPLGDSKSNAVSPASCPSTAPASTHRCDCRICQDADLAPHGPLRDWRRQLRMMRQEQMFKTSSRKTFSPATDSPHSQSPTAATAGKEQDTRSASDGLGVAIAIVTLYCDDLTGEQNELADMGRQLQQQVANQCCGGLQRGGLLDVGSAASQTASRASSVSPGTGGGGSASIRRVHAPPAAEAASVPGHVPTETERGLDLACQILKSVHAAVPLLTDAWSDLRNIQKGSTFSVMSGTLELSPPKGGATNKTGFSKPSQLPEEARPLRALVTTAKNAAVAAESAVKAQGAARRVDASESAAQPPRNLRQDQISRLTGLAAVKHLNLETTDGSSRGSERSIPCPTLLTTQTTSGQLTKGSRSRQPNTTLPAPSKPARRIGAGSGSSTSDSPAHGRRALAQLRNWSGGSAAPPPRQMHGLIGRYNTQPADAPASQLARAGGKHQTGAPVFAPPLHLSSMTNDLQRRASGMRGVLNRPAFDGINPPPRQEAADAASTASMVSGGTSAAQRLPPAEPAAVVSLEPSAAQSDNGQSSPSPCLLECLENHFEPGGPGEGSQSSAPTESQQAQQRRLLDSPASGSGSNFGTRASGDAAS